MPRFSRRANLLKELEAVAKSRVIKAYLRFYLDAEDSFKDDLDHYVAVKLFALKESRYALERRTEHGAVIGNGCSTMVSI